MAFFMSRGRHAFDARRAMHRRGDDRHLPAQPGARLHAHGVERDGQKPAGDLLARRHHDVIFALVGNSLDVATDPWRLAASLVQATSLLVSPAMAETTTATLLPALDFAFDQRGDMADALQVGHRGAAEFHRDQRHRLICPKGNGGLRIRGRPSLNPGDQPSNMTAQLPPIDPPIDPAEVAKFSAMAAEWWDPDGQICPPAQVQSRSGWTSSGARRAAISGATRGA